MFATPPVEIATRSLRTAHRRRGRALLAAIGGRRRSVEPLYRARYGLDLLGEPPETIILYRRKDAYRMLQERSDRIRGLPVAATSAGVWWCSTPARAALPAGSVDRAAVTSWRSAEPSRRSDRRCRPGSTRGWPTTSPRTSWGRRASRAKRHSTACAPSTATASRSAARWRASICWRRRYAHDRTAAADRSSRSTGRASSKEPPAQLHYAASAWLVRYPARRGLGPRRRVPRVPRPEWRAARAASRPTSKPRSAGRGRSSSRAGAPTSRGARSAREWGRQRPRRYRARRERLLLAPARSPSE